MTIYRPDEWDIAADHEQRIKIIESGCPSFNFPSDDQFENGWTHAGPPYELWGYRVCDGGLDMIGHLQPGTPGAVAYTFPLEFLAFAAGNLTDHREVISGGQPTLALLVIDIFSGAMTITF